jgi:hypothetical protein
MQGRRVTFADQALRKPAVQLQWTSSARGFILGFVGCRPAFAAWLVIRALAVANGVFRDAFVLPRLGSPAALLTSGILLMLCSPVVVAHVLVSRCRPDIRCQCVDIGLFWKPRQFHVERQPEDRVATKQVHGNDKARDNRPAPAAAEALRPRAAGTADDQQKGPP